jgi:ArsR family transcriptional regulator
VAAIRTFPDPALFLFFTSDLFARVAPRAAARRTPTSAVRHAALSAERLPREDVPLMTQVSASPRTRTARPPSLDTTPIKVSEETLHRMTDVFKLLADKSRLKIVLALAQDGELHVSALCDLLGDESGRPASQPAVSHHLTLMRMVGLVSFNRHGKHNFYHLASGHMRDLFEQFFADSGNGQKSLHFEDFALTFKRKA